MPRKHKAKIIAAQSVQPPAPPMLRLLTLAQALAERAEQERDPEEQMRLFNLAADAFRRAGQAAQNAGFYNLVFNSGLRAPLAAERNTSIAEDERIIRVIGPLAEEGATATLNTAMDDAGENIEGRLIASVSAPASPTIGEEEEMYGSIYHPQTRDGEAAATRQRAPLPPLPVSPVHPTPATGELAVTAETLRHKENAWEDVGDGSWYTTIDTQPAVDAPPLSITEEPLLPPTPASSPISEEGEDAAVEETLGGRILIEQRGRYDINFQTTVTPAPIITNMGENEEEDDGLVHVDEPTPEALEETDGDIVHIDEPTPTALEETDGDIVHVRQPTLQIIEEGDEETDDVTYIEQPPITEPTGGITLVEAVTTFTADELSATAPVPVLSEAAPQDAGWGLGARLLGAGWLWGNTATEAAPLTQAAPEPVEPSPATHIFTALPPVDELMFPNGANPFAPPIFAMGIDSPSVI